MRGKNTDRSIIDYVTGVASLNDGYLHLPGVVPELKRLGYISSESSDAEAVRTIIKIINREKNFVKIEGQKNIRRLKRFI